MQGMNVVHLKNLTESLHGCDLFCRQKKKVPVTQLLA